MITNEGKVISVRATGTIAASRFVRADGIQAVLNQRAIGVAFDGVIAGEMCPVAIDGVVGLETGAAVAIGDNLTSDATGRGIVAGVNPVNAIALEAAGAAGIFIRVKVL